LSGYRIEFFNRNVEMEVMGWPDSILASFVRITERMLDFGPNLGMPYTKSLGKGLFEIRARGSEGIGRALFYMQVGRRIVIVHAFIKKSQETPLQDLRLARKRMSEVVNDQGKK
jgi:phage-related protein